MKKFINDNLWWMMIAALAIGGYALYKVMHKDETEVTLTTATE